MLVDTRSNLCGNFSRFRRNLGDGPKIAFPSDDHAPLSGMQLIERRRVASDVATELLDPEFSVGLGRRRNLAAFVPVPKTAMHEDDRAILREDDVGLPRQATSMEPKPKSEPVKCPPQGNLGLRIG